MDLSQNQDHIWAVIAMDIPAKLVLTSRSVKGFATPRWYYFGLMAYLIIRPLAGSFYFYTYIYSFLNIVLRDASLVHADGEVLHYGHTQRVGRQTNIYKCI